MEAHIRRVLERVQLPAPPRKPQRERRDRRQRFELEDAAAPAPDPAEPALRRDASLPLGHAADDESGFRVDVTA
jgi:hypothetical protein